MGPADVSVMLKITREGNTTYERYTFFNDQGEWKLWKIEQGLYRMV